MTDTQEPKSIPVGRPTDYSPEVAAAFLAELAMGASVRTVCLDESMPCRATIYVWLQKHPEFVDQYTRAKSDGAIAIFEDTLDISDDGTNDYMTIKDQKTGKDIVVFNKENVQRSKLRVETRKWYLSKLMPKVYGEAVLLKNQQLDDKGNPTNPVSAEPYLALALAAVKKGEELAKES